MASGQADSAVALPAPAARPTRVLRRLTDGSGARWLLVLPLLLMLLCLVIPLIMLVTTAFQDGADSTLEAITSSLYLDAIRRTAVLAAVVTAICLLVGTVYSLGLALTRGWLRILLLATLFITFWISLLVRTYGWIILFQPAGLLDKLMQSLGLHEGPLDVLQTTLAMYPGMVHIMLPYMILPIYASVMSLDPSQLRAAQSLGARPLTILRRVILPQLRAGTLAGVVLVFILSLGFFITPRFLGGPEDLTVATIIDREFSQVYDFAAASAMGVALLVAVLLLYLLADRVLGVSKQWEGM